jgi:hypothetical protein
MLIDSWSTKKSGLKSCIPYTKNTIAKTLDITNKQTKLLKNQICQVLTAEIYGDVVYLKDKRLIKGQTFLGDTHPRWIIITSYGIDTVENGVDNFIENVDTANVEQPVKDEIKDISKKDYSTREKIRNVVDSLQKHAALFALVKDITVLISGYR